jgi:hypothetical protein
MTFRAWVSAGARLQIEVVGAESLVYRGLASWAKRSIPFAPGKAAFDTDAPPSSDTIATKMSHLIAPE